jgi:adenosyl cobinamide kinase/adenosyl cobinamide phosphate guanylyltransferase
MRRIIKAPQTIVLLSGYARSGKDTFAEGMTRYSVDIKRIAYADALKDAANEYARNLGLSVNFHEETFKAQHRDTLVAMGRFARSIHRDVFVFNLTEAANRERGHVVVTDCRYLNETIVTKQIMGEVRGWRVIHLHIETEGVGPANDEEASSIREMLEGVIPDQTYVFKPNTAAMIRDVGKSVAKHLEL